MKYIISTLLLFSTISCFSQDYVSLNKNYSKHHISKLFEPYRYNTDPQFLLSKDNVKCTYGYTVNNKWVIPPKYDEVQYFLGNYCIASLNGKWGVIDKQNNTVIPFKYEQLNWYSTSNSPQYYSYSSQEPDTTRLMFSNGDKLGMLSISGDTIFKPIYTWISPAVFGMANICKDSSEALVVNNKIVTPFQFEALTVLDEGLVAFKVGEKRGIIDDKGNVLLKPEYNLISFKKNGVYVIVKDKQFGFFVDGTVTVEAKYEDLIFQGRGSKEFTVKKDGRFGVIDNTGKIIIPIIYKNSIRYTPTQNGLKILHPPFINYYGAATSKGQDTRGWIGLADSSGNQICEPTYVDLYYDTAFDVFVAATFDSVFILNSKGEKVTQYHKKYDAPLFINGITANKSSGGKYQFINVLGKPINKLVYDNLKPIGYNPYGFKGYFAKSGNKWGIVSSIGELIIPIEFESIGKLRNTDGHPSFGMFFLKKNKLYIKDNKELRQYIQEEDKMVFEDIYTDDVNNLIVINKSGMALPITKSSAIISMFDFDCECYYYLIYNKTAGCKIVNQNYNLVKDLSNYSDIDVDRDKSYLVTHLKGYSDNKVGLLTIKGEELIPAKYRSIYVFGDQIWVREFVPSRIDSLKGYDYSYSPKLTKGKWAVFGLNGKQLTSFIYDKAEHLNLVNQVSYFNTEAQKQGINDLKGKAVIEPKYDTIYLSSSKVYYVLKDNLWSIIDTNGNVILEPKYNFITETFGDLIMVGTRNKKGEFINEAIINSKGEYIVQPSLNSINKHQFALKRYTNLNDTSQYKLSSTIINGHQIDEYRSNWLSISLVSNNHKQSTQINNLLIRSVLMQLEIERFAPSCLDNYGKCTVIRYGQTRDYIFKEMEHPFEQWIVVNISMLDVDFISVTDNYDFVSHFYNKGDYWGALLLSDLFKDVSSINSFLVDYISSISSPLNYCSNPDELYKIFEDKFEIKKDGILFPFNDDYKLLLPYSKIKHLIKPNSPIDELLN